MLLANGYRLVDAAASKGQGGDALAMAYVSWKVRGLFQKDQYYIDSFRFGSKDGSPTSERCDGETELRFVVYRQRELGGCRWPPHALEIGPALPKNI